MTMPRSISFARFPRKPSFDVIDSPVFMAKCWTYALACEMAGDWRLVTPGNVANIPPFCLRRLPAYRTAEMQRFRDAVAAKARAIRNA